MEPKKWRFEALTVSAGTHCVGRWAEREAIAQGALPGVDDGSCGTAIGYVPCGHALSFPSVCGHRFASVDDCGRERMREPFVDS